jgi:hypothetical protein
LARHIWPYSKLFPAWEQTCWSAAAACPCDRQLCTLKVGLRVTQQICAPLCVGSVLVSRKNSITWFLLPWKSGVIVYNCAGQGSRVHQLSAILIPLKCNLRKNLFKVRLVGQS